MTAYHTYEDGALFISCLILADNNLRQSSKDPTNIRWIIVALHDALYALLIEKLTRTDGFGVFDDKFERKVSDFYAAGYSSRSSEFMALAESSFRVKTASIGRLLDRAKLPSKVEITRDEADELARPSRGLSRLKFMRDLYAHPRPGITSFGEDYILEACTDTLQVIKELHATPGERAERHDPREAAILLESIDYYLQKWGVKIESDDPSFHWLPTAGW